MKKSDYENLMREYACENKMMWAIAIAIAIVFGLAYAFTLLQAMGIWIH